VRERKTNTSVIFWIGAKYLQNSLYQLLGRHDRTIAIENALDAEKFVIETDGCVRQQSRCQFAGGKCWRRSTAGKFQQTFE
jgi:hypothetical protein